MRHITVRIDERLQTPAAAAQVQTPGVTWIYDPAYARVLTMSDGSGTTTYTYHPVGQLGAGQVATVDGPLGNDVVSYAYDELGRLATRAIDGVPLTVTYDALGRVRREVNALGTFDYTFDSTSARLATVTYPNNQTSTYSYFPAAQDHRLQTIRHQTPAGTTLSMFDYTYDAAGNIATWRQQTGSTAVIWDYAYDRADQLIRAVKRATDPQGTVLQRFAYGYDPGGNRLFEQVDDTVTASTYDRLNRLVTQQGGGVLRVAGTINEVATVRIDGRPASAVTADGLFVGGVNVAPGTTRFTISATDPSGNTAAQSYDVDQSGAAKTFTFDANGNMISDGSRTYTWDARDQLIAVTAGSARSEFSYDGFKRRVGTVLKENGSVVSESRTLWCSTAACEDRNGDGASVLRRAFTLGQQVGGSAGFFAQDHLGSVVQVTDVQSSVLASYSYDPWGRRSLTGGADTTAVGFTGHTAAHSGLAMTLYRAYDAELGRWLSEDPLSVGGGINLYGYVRNNPVNLWDPLGLTECEETPCDELLKEILNMAAEVSRRYMEYNNPKYRLELTGKNSRQGHIRQIESDQQGLRNRMQKYNDQNCPSPIPVAVEDLATRPLPKLTPSPVGLPEFPPPTPGQVRQMGETLTIGLIGAALLMLWWVLG